MPRILRTTIALFFVSLACSHTPQSTAGLVQWLDASDPGAFVTDIDGNVTQWNDLSGSGNNAPLAASSLGVLKPASRAFAQGLFGLDFDAGGANSDSSFEDGAQHRVAVELFNASGASNLLNSANGFTILLTVDPDGAEDGLDNACTTWNDLIGNSSVFGGAGAYAMRWGQGGGSGADPGRIQTYFNAQSGSNPLRGNVQFTDSEDKVHNVGKGFVLAMNYQRDLGLMTVASSLIDKTKEGNRPATVTVTIDDVATEVDAVFGNGSPLLLGYAGDGGQPTRFFDGQVGEVRVYDSALSSADFLTEVEALNEKWSLDFDGALFLDVDRGSGQMTLRNSGSTPIDLIGLRFQSDSGALNGASWKSISDFYDADDDSSVDDTNNWLEFAASDFDLAEATDPSGISAIAAAASSPDTPFTIDLGTAFRPGATEDIVAQYFDPTTGDSIKIFVKYSGEAATLIGDYNNDGSVDAADYAVWRNNLNANIELPNTDPADTDDTVTNAEYQAWRANFGANSGSASVAESIAAPEPAGLALAAVLAPWLLRRRSRVITRPLSQTAVIVAVASLLMSSAHAERTIDREYLLGDEGSFIDDIEPIGWTGEGATVGQPLTSNNIGGYTIDWAGRGGFGDIIAVLAGGSTTPTYANVGAGGIGGGRPFAAADGSSIGVQFGGGYVASVFTNTHVPDTDPDYGTQKGTSEGGVGKPSQAAALDPSLNYPNGATERGMQAWVYPTDNSGGSVQDVFNDTYQFGIQISENNNWALTWGLETFDATAGAMVESADAVQFNQWTHVMNHSYRQDYGVLYVNGVAVAVRGHSPASDQYFNVPETDTDPLFLPNSVRNLTLGASLDLTPTFTGVIDDAEVYVTGGNNPETFEWGRFFLGEDNDYIRHTMAGIVDGDTKWNGSFDGVVDDNDVAFFISHWGDQQIIGGGPVGDLNSRNDLADFNYDGVVDFADWFMLRQNYSGASNPSLSALLAARAAPEPSAVAMLSLLACSSMIRSRFRSA